MNSQLNEVVGLVEKKGDKFNGSVAIGGNWYNFKKGVDHSGISKGDTVKLELGEWEFKGKTGKNIVSWSSVDNPVHREPKEEIIKAVNKETAIKGRDFDAEARGKTRCAMFAAALSSPALAQFVSGSVNELIQEAEKVADAGVKYTFGD